MANGTVPLNFPSFSDPRMILVHCEGEYCARFWDESQAGYEQEHDGPTHLIIGRHAGFSIQYEHRKTTSLSRQCGTCAERPTRSVHLDRSARLPFAPPMQRCTFVELDND